MGIYKGLSAIKYDFILLSFDQIQHLNIFILIERILLLLKMLMFLVGSGSYLIGSFRLNISHIYMPSPEEA